MSYILSKHVSKVQILFWDLKKQIYDNWTKFYNLTIIEKLN